MQIKLSKDKIGQLNGKLKESNQVIKRLKEKILEGEALRLKEGPEVAQKKQSKVVEKKEALDTPNSKQELKIKEMQKKI